MYDRKERKYDRKESFCITEKNKIEIQNPNKSINPNSSILYQPILFKILINNNIPPAFTFGLQKYDFIFN